MSRINWINLFSFHTRYDINCYNNFQYLTLLTDYRTGPCYTAFRHGSCQAPLPGVTCTKQMCCATIGVAWGHPCVECPRRLTCPKGYLKNNNNECVGALLKFLCIFLRFKTFFNYYSNIFYLIALGLKHIATVSFKLTVINITIYNFKV